MGDSTAMSRVPARAEIVVDVAAIRRNVRLLKAHSGTALMTVVKADGYGHGMVEAARAAREGGADWLGVATLEEAVALRAAGDSGRILFWLTVPGEDYATAIAHDLDITVSSTQALDEVVAAGADRPARVQIKVDTGLHRNGAVRADWHDLFIAAADHEREDRIRVTGIWSHFASSDEPDDPANAAQEAVFEEALGLAADAGLKPEVRHLANSAAAILRPSARFDLVRVGIASYGLDPAPGHTPDMGLVPAMTVRATLALVKPVAAGESVSYGHTWTAERDTSVGLVPVGYGEGLPRSGSNRGQVSLDGVRRPVRGRICMDQFMIDLDGAPAAAGDDVTIFGNGHAGEPTAQDWAEACGTISYEIVTRMGGRMVRTYVDSDREEVS